MPPKHPASVDVAKSPLGVLRFLYVGSSDVSRDLEYYTKTLEAKKVWDFTSMGTRVAAIKVCSGPLLLLAGRAIGLAKRSSGATYDVSAPAPQENTWTLI